MKNTCHVHGLEDNIIKMSILPKVICRFNAKDRNRKLHLEFLWNLKEPRIVKTILKKNKTGELILPDFKI